MENLNDSQGINRAWENIKETIKTSAKGSLGLYERKQHKLCFEEECSEFLDQRKQAKMQWVQVSNRSKLDNLNTARIKLVDISGTKEGYLKAKID